MPFFRDLLPTDPPEFSHRNASSSLHQKSQITLEGLGLLSAQPAHQTNALSPLNFVQDKPPYLEAYASADFGDELQKPYWTIDDGIPNLLSINPAFAQVSDLKPNRYRDKIANEGMRLRELVQMAQDVCDLQQRFRPIDFINWALAQHINVPAKLVGLALKRGLPVLDITHPSELARRETVETVQTTLKEWSLQIENLQRIVSERDEQIFQQDAIIAHLEAINARLPTEQTGAATVAPMSAEISSSGKGASTKKYNTASKVAFGICKLRYNIDPASPQGLQCAKIISELATINISIDDQTLRPLLLNGSEVASK